MIDINNFLSHNPVLGGGAVLAGAGSIIAWVRNGPSKVINWLKTRVITVVTINDNNHMYSWVEHWFRHHPYCKTARNIIATLGSEYNEFGEEYEVYRLHPGYGEHFIKYKNTYLWVSSIKEDSKSGGQKFSYTIAFLTLNKKIIEDFFDEIAHNYNNQNKNKVSVFVPRGTSWDHQGYTGKRKIESLVCAEGIKEKLVEDISHHLNNRRWYADLGLPYRRGYLLYGPPGSGKSTTVKVLAAHLNQDLYILDLSDPNMTDSDLIYMVGRSNGGILLIEDIDSAFIQRESGDQKKGVSFSGLLNAIDGVASRDGQLLFMTTNHIEKLDPALIRPGRIDILVELNNADENQAYTLFKRFFLNLKRH